MDILQQIDKKIRGDNQKIIKKIEYLSGELNLLVNDNSSEDKGQGTIIDTTKLVDQNLFKDNKKEINKKFNKIDYLLKKSQENWTNFRKIIPYHK